MNYTNFVRGIVKKNKNLPIKLKKADSKLTPHQYVHQAITMTVLSQFFGSTLLFMVFRANLLLTIGLIALLLVASPIVFKFWMKYVDAQIRKYARELDGDLLFISEYFLVTLESGLPLGNAIKRLSELDRPGGRFFKKVYLDFKTGKDLESALDDAAVNSPSETLKTLLKRLKDSLDIGVDLRMVLSNFVEDSSEKKIVEIKAYAKKLNPIVMMYLLLGIVVPSLGVTFLILGIAIASPGTPELLMYILGFVFLFMFTFQYFAFSMFRFSKSTL